MDNLNTYKETLNETTRYNIFIIFNINRNVETLEFIQGEYSDGLNSTHVRIYYVLRRAINYCNNCTEQLIKNENNKATELIFYLIDGAKAYIERAVQIIKG